MNTVSGIDHIRYLNVFQEMMIPKIYGFVGLTCKLKALWEDIRTTETITLYIYIYTSEKPTLRVDFRPTFGQL